MDRREKVAYLFTLNDDQADEIEGDKYLRKGADFEIEEDVLNCGEMNENIPITSPITPTAPTPPILSPHINSIDPTNCPSKQQTSVLPIPETCSRQRGYLEKAGNFRWIILALSCFIMFGNFYAYDNPSALNRQLKSWMADKSDGEFEYHLNLLYTVYSVPNIVLPFVVGRALDEYGSRSFLVGLSLLMCLGQTIFSIGVSEKSWLWMMIGRLVFGLGGESLAVAQSRLVTEWFLGKELGIAIGLNLSIARIGTVFNNNASPRIAAVEGGGVAEACWVGLFTCLFSLVCTLVCILIDSIYRPTEPESYPLITLASINDFKRSDSREDASTVRRTNQRSLDNDEEFIHPAFYFLLFLTFLSYGAVLCFNTVASAYLQERYFLDDILRANWAMSIPDTAAIFMVPLVGFVVDRSGWKLATIILGQAALGLGHIWLALSKSPSSPFGALFTLGIGYSTLLAIWSCVPYLVGLKRQATAYGSLASSTNLSSTLLPIFVATFVNADKTYLLAGIFFSLLGASGLLICLKVSAMNASESLLLNSERAPSHMLSFYRIQGRDPGNDPKGLKGFRIISSDEVAPFGPSNSQLKRPNVVKRNQVVPVVSKCLNE